MLEIKPKALSMLAKNHWAMALAPYSFWVLDQSFGVDSEVKILKKWILGTGRSEVGFPGSSEYFGQREMEQESQSALLW